MPADEDATHILPFPGATDTAEVVGVLDCDGIEMIVIVSAEAGGRLVAMDRRTGRKVTVNLSCAFSALRTLPLRVLPSPRWRRAPRA
jgi:hypothetical protein